MGISAFIPRNMNHDEIKWISIQWFSGILQNSLINRGLASQGASKAVHSGQHWEPGPKSRDNNGGFCEQTIGYMDSSHCDF